MCDGHGDVGLALGDDHLVGLVAHDGHRLALEPGHQVLVVVMMVVMVVVMIMVMVYIQVANPNHRLTPQEPARQLRRPF